VIVVETDKSEPMIKMEKETRDDKIMTIIVGPVDSISATPV